MNYFGIDIGGTAIKYGIVDEAGHVLISEEYPDNFDGYKTPILTTLLATSKQFLENNKIDTMTLAGIGVSATGQIDCEAGVVAGVGGNIINWEGAAIKDSLIEKYHLPVTVVNDANCVALAEAWIGGAKGCHDVIVVTIGTGVGGGIIVNDRILLGHRGFGGELGHIVIAKDGVPCTCGNTGCYERYASMTALVKNVRAVLPIDGLLGYTADKVNGRTIFEQVAAGQPVISKIVDQWIADIATGLVSLTHIFNPEIILLGGGVSAQEELFISKVRTQVKKRVMGNFGKELRVEGAALKNSAGLIGAVHYLIQSMNASQSVDVRSR